MTDRPLRVLFVCTGNSARSILAEALLRHHAFQVVFTPLAERIRQFVLIAGRTAAAGVA